LYGLLTWAANRIDHPGPRPTTKNQHLNFDRLEDFAASLPPASWPPGAEYLVSNQKHMYPTIGPAAQKIEQNNRALDCPGTRFLGSATPTPRRRLLGLVRQGSGNQQPRRWPDLGLARQVNDSSFHAIRRPVHRTETPATSVRARAPDATVEACVRRFFFFFFFFRFFPLLCARRWGFPLTRPMLALAPPDLDQNRWGPGPGHWYSSSLGLGPAFRPSPPLEPTHPLPSRGPVTGFRPSLETSRPVAMGPGLLTTTENLLPSIV